MTFDMKKLIATLHFLLCLLATASAQSTTKVYAFQNGQWYDGQSFVTATWYTVNGLLSKKAPAKVDSVINLEGKYVIPPFGDAHCSSVSENPSAANTLSMYMGEGVYYLQIVGNTQEGRSASSPLMNKPTAPDALFSNGVITCTLGYPFLEYEGPANKIKNPNQWGERYAELKTSQKMLGNGYWFIDNKEAIAANWDKIKMQRPDVIFIYLLDVEKNGGKEGKGLSAEVAKMVIKKAHKAGLRVFAQVETADDLRLGVKLGVDGFANIPGHNWDGNGEVKKYELTDADLKVLAKKKTPIVLLLSHGQAAVNKAAVQAFHKKTLVQLKKAGVVAVMGSDDNQRTLRMELNYWFGLGELDDAWTLKVLCENTPKAIFPKRKIARFENGYEANFLVLADNPLTNVLKSRVQAFKVKNGVILK
jgi:imidazolonepropionase-like amidohydrolase